MTELIGLTLLEQIRLLIPYFIYSGITFTAMIIASLAVRAISHHRWKRLEEERLPETVRRKLSGRDREIRSLRNQIGKQDGIIERYSVAVRAANAMNHRVSEILQMPLINEVARKKRAG